MDLTWNLDTIYTSFDSEKFKNDMESLNHYVTILNEWAINNLKDVNCISSKIEEFLKLNNEYRSLYSCLVSYAYLIVSVDVDNIQAMNILDDIESKDSELTETIVSFNRWLSYIKNIDEIIDSSPYLSEHRFYLKEIIMKSKYLLSEKEELVIAKMQSTGSRAWQRLYMDLSSTILTEIEIEGKLEKMPLSVLKNMAYEKDASLRKAAYYAEIEAYKNISKVSAACINGISGEALTIYEMRGYKSPLEKVLIDSRMDFNTLNAMISAIKESLPIFHKYYYKKAEVLGHKSNLPFYDIFAPIGNANEKLSYLEASNLIISSFRTFNEDLARFAKMIFDNRWIDAEPRKGKGSYGLSVDIFPIKESRIMTNFTGNYIDVGILSHEIGHAYHSSCLFNEKMLNTEYPIPIAETASIFCETIVNNALLKTVSTNEALAILERSISDAGYYVVNMYGRYLFETELFERRKSGALSVDDLNEIMLNSMKEAYGNSIDTNSIHPYMWLNNIGYYMPSNEFCNFPYAFGVLFSKGLYAEYMKRGETFADEYDGFLKSTSKNNIVDIAKLMNIDVHSIDFWRNALKLIKMDIEDFISRV